MFDTFPQDSTLSGLSPTQVIAALALAQGASITKAAQSAGIHRSTIYNWLDDDPRFASAVHQATEEYVSSLRDCLKDLSVKSLETIQTLMEDTGTPATVRLHAALAVLRRPRFPKQEWALADSLEFRRPHDEPIHLVWYDSEQKVGTVVARKPGPAKAA